MELKKIIGSLNNLKNIELISRYRCHRQLLYKIPNICNSPLYIKTFYMTLTSLYNNNYISPAISILEAHKSKAVFLKVNQWYSSSEMKTDSKLQRASLLYK